MLRLNAICYDKYECIVRRHLTAGIGLVIACMHAVPGN